jgi:hypothetical protein
MRPITASKLVIIGVAVVGISFVTGEASAETISQGGANSICSRHGGMGSTKGGCAWCGPHTCTSIVCKSGDCDVKIIKSSKTGPSNGGRTKGGPKTPPIGPSSPPSHHADASGRRH